MRSEVARDTETQRYRDVPEATCCGLRSLHSTSPAQAAAAAKVSSGGSQKTIWGRSLLARVREENKERSKMTF